MRVAQQNPSQQIIRSMQKILLYIALGVLGVHAVIVTNAINRMKMQVSVKMKNVVETTIKSRQDQLSTHMLVLLGIHMKRKVDLMTVTK